MTDQPQRIGQEPAGAKSDPTALTTDQLQREMAHMSGLLKSELNTINQSILDQEKLRNAQLANIQQQLAHAESLRKELKDDNEKNIDRALSGVERANEKLEVAMTRTLTQVMESNKADTEGLRRDIDGLKDRIGDNTGRIGGIEQRGVGGKEATSERRESNAAVYAAIGIGGVVLSALMGLFGFMAARGGP